MESNEPEQARKIFIGGLDYAATEDSLREVFELWGEIVDVVVIKDPITNRSRGFGFITYSQSSMVDRAMSIRPIKINGREVDAKRAVPREDIDEFYTRATVKQIYFYGIKKQSKNDLREYFKKFGNITNIQIVTTKDSGKIKGYGFIEYDNTDSVDKAILIHKHTVAGGKLYVKKAIKRTNVASCSRGIRSGYGGVNRSSWNVDSRFGQQGRYYNRSNGSVEGYGIRGMSGRYSSIRGMDGYGAREYVYNSNSGRPCPGVHQRLGYNNPARGNQRGGWGVSQQPRF